MNAQSCATDYGFPWTGPKGYNPLNLPVGQPGTLPLSNNAGNAFTVFDPPVFTMALFPAFTSTISAAKFVATAGANSITSLASSGALAGLGGTTATGSSAKNTATTTGAGATPSTTTTKNSAGITLKKNFRLGGSLAIILAIYSL